MSTTHRSPEAVATRGRSGMVAAQVVSEIRRTARVPEYFIGVVVLPVILFAMFGLPNSGETLPGGTTVVAMIFVSFACYGVVSQALFSFGAELAAERLQGWLRRLRSTPMPMWVYFAGKLALNLVFTLVIVGGIALLAALAGDARFDASRLATTTAVLLLGTLVFSPMGSAIAYWARPRAASTIVNLVFLPLSFLSGFFFPLSQLPTVLQGVAPWLPTYHFGQLAWSSMAPAADREIFGAGDETSIAVSLVVVLAWGAACTVATAAGYRRELDRERG
ncbi:ABC transporter [Flavimobilis marinus]|uniref:ABC-2 type transport system permease protein n=1 Tax=Flavimobilis marinus TaxID=285351 RepID=A0A1I2E6I2_9MICO|nr:ABC transporter permease [Flavimobilis marinus]GHG43637.1 ABC transporter [Flavimobilis marinus]SFE87880.1 ABC-2 type transport system permease protein [Flavimobilis marinus]